MFCEALIEKLDFASLGEGYDIVFDLYNDSDSAFISKATSKRNKFYAVAHTPTPKSGWNVV
ncbi:MAG: hypothetical protein ACLRSW_04215 [Christensenellaceae bacterium]